jgi:anaerobic magnesium-protoporphyrin IX monomethyl ester cyclase
MVTSVDTSIEINYTSATERDVERSAEFPSVELTKVKRHITLVRLPYANIYSVYGKLPKNREVRPPLGLLYIAASLEEAGHTVNIIDCETKLYPPEVTLQLILDSNPDIVGFTATTPEIHGVESLSKSLKEANADIKIMVGGSHVSAMPRQTLADCPYLDYIVVGEGELSVVHIANDLPDTPIIRTKNEKTVDSYPLPARHLLEYGEYKYAWPGRGMVKMDVLESIRGCPFMCTFCSVRGVKPRLRDITRVVDEIEFSYKTYGTELFMFFDDTLTVNRYHVFDLCDEIIKRGLNKHVVFYANTRANTTTPEMLDKMIEAGFTEMSMGVETGSAQMMKAIKKGTRVEQYEQVYEWMEQRGLQTRASFIVGHAHETHETVLESIKFAKKIKLMRCAVNILTPYPDTHSYDQALAGDGLHLLCKDWREFKRWGTAVIRTDDLTAEDLVWYQRRFLT